MNEILFCLLVVLNVCSVWAQPKTLKFLQARCKHLGTENNLRILQNIYEGLKDKLEFRFNTPVTHIAREGEDFRLTLGKGEELSCRWLIAAPGRSGAEWFAEECKGCLLYTSRCV